MQKISSVITYLLVALAIGIFLAVAIPKILFPYEAHWMEGSMLEQVGRILGGKSLYVSPTIYYVPWLYEPLYHYSTAALASFAGLSYPIARLPSILSTTATLTLLYFVIYKETNKMFLGMTSVGLYLASYGKAEYCFVMARIDPLFNFFLLAAFVAVYFSHTNRGLIGAALLIALSYFTKQTALVFVFPIAVYFWRVQGWKPALFFVGGVSLFIISGIFLLDRIYDGWFTYYTLSVPEGKGKAIRWAYALDGLFIYIIFRCWLVTTFLSIIPLKKLFAKRIKNGTDPLLLFGLFFITGLAAGFLGILNYGGGHNVLLPAATGCALFLPVLTRDFIANKNFARFVVWVTPIQIAFLLSNPWKDPRNIASKTDEINQEQFFHGISLDSGEIWIPYHGYTKKFTGKNSYADYVAIRDVLLTDDSTSHRLQNELDTAFKNRHWHYIFSDILDTIPYYSLSEKTINLNKVRVNDDTLLYIYKPND